MVLEQIYSILIVEDEVNIANALCSGLQNEGYMALSVNSGEEALFELSSQSFNLVILDVMLPGRDGFEILKILRSKRDKVSVLMLTARDSIEDKVAGLDNGADDYLVKPFAFAELLARIRVLLKRSKQENDLTRKSNAYRSQRKCKW